MSRESIISKIRAQLVKSEPRITSNELMSLLVLNGGARMPHLETEIFTNLELTNIYVGRVLPDLRSSMDWVGSYYRLVLIAKHFWCRIPCFEKQLLLPREDELNGYDHMHVRAIMGYAIDIMGCRWLEAEHILYHNISIVPEYVAMFGFPPEPCRLGFSLPRWMCPN